ncbi:sugar MFS transporter [Chitinophaga deserti]|uniref:sugar MFS transporter n=1 Tax=Chitinophaga deserti TaxID=2164099 RepID=UPI0018E4F943|nr:sugar MFS transporter [Chitinophaga deserti]
MANVLMPELSVRNEMPAGKSYLPALLSLAVLYFMLGFITCLNDTLIPYFKAGFTLSYTESSLVQFYFFAVYGIFSIPAGRIIGRIGYRKGMVTGFLVAAAGALLFYPAALLHAYYLFLGALFVVAVGIVFMQVSANPYIVVLGRPETASSRMNLIQSVGSIGTIVAPLFGAAVILPNMTAGASSAVKYPYAGIALVLVVISLILWKMKLPEVKPAVEEASANSGSALGFRNLKLGALAIFFYVGAEVAVGSFLTNYIADTLAITEQEANRYVSFYWGAMLAGRLAGVGILRFMQPQKLLALNALAAIALILISIFSSGALAVWSLISVGLCNSVMFAIIFSLSVNGLGKQMTQASGILSAAISGGAVIVVLQGWLIDSASWATAFIIPVLCYAYIVFYGLNGFKPRSGIAKSV